MGVISEGMAAGPTWSMAGIAAKMQTLLRKTKLKITRRAFLSTLSYPTEWLEKDYTRIVINILTVQRNFMRLLQFEEIIMYSDYLKIAVLHLLLVFCFAANADVTAVSDQEMQAVYEQVKTPYKYGVVIEPPEGMMVDGPTVFRRNDKWYMVYFQLESAPQGYTTHLAVSDDLLNWKPLGVILPRGQANAWDSAQAAGGIALCDTTWGGSYELKSHDGKYWLSYLGGRNPGYETPPLSIGVAWTEDPTAVQPWHRPDAPSLQPTDPNIRNFEGRTLFKSYIFLDKQQTLGAPFVMFYNAAAVEGGERIGIALSENMTDWKRFGQSHVLANQSSTGKVGISGDPQITKIGKLWVMFYFGAFWKPGAFDTFACSYDLVHWSKWDGPDLVAPSESWDQKYAHKPWVIQHNGVVYHFYCAVGDKGRVIALATSKDLRNNSGHEYPQ